MLWKRFKFNTEEESRVVLETITEDFKKKGLGDRLILKKRVMLEEIFAQALELAEQKSVRVIFRQMGNDISVKVMYKGADFAFSDSFIPRIQAAFALEEGLTADELEDFRTLMLLKYRSNLSVSRKDSLNTVKLVVMTSGQKALRNTVIALLSGLAFGVIFRMAAGDIAVWAAENLLTTVYSMFLNAIKIVAGPLVYTIMTLGIAGNENVGGMGKMVRRLGLMFFIVSALSMVLSFALFQAFPVGSPALQSMVSEGLHDSGSYSILTLIVETVPSSFIAPLVYGNMLQILFLGVISGIAAAGLGEGSSKIIDAFRTMELFISGIAGLILKFMPLSIFCSISAMAITTDVQAMLALLGWLFRVLGMMLLMLVVIGLLVASFTGKSPFKFYVKYKEVMLNAMALGSSSAVMPLNMKVCRDKLGISPKVYSLSIPLGMMVNANGVLVNMMVTALFMTRIYEVKLSVMSILCMAVMIYILALSAPPIPGAMLIVYATLFPSIGVPAGAVTIIMGLMPLIDPVETMLNVSGTAACSFIAARWSGLLNDRIWDNTL